MVKFDVYLFILLTFSNLHADNIKTKFYFYQAFGFFGNEPNADITVPFVPVTFVVNVA